jgi:ribonucleases P/MRP protein subunit RPP40
LQASTADNTKVGNRIRTDEDRARLQAALDQMCTWTAVWGMNYNAQKCKIMHFGKKNPKHTYVMEGVQLEEVTEERDIDVIVSNNLKPVKQCAKARRRPEQSSDRFLEPSTSGISPHQ